MISVALIGEGCYVLRGLSGEIANGGYSNAVWEGFFSVCPTHINGQPTSFWRWRDRMINDQLIADVFSCHRHAELNTWYLPMSDKLFEMTASESAERAAVLPTVPTEDVSSLLGKIEPRQGESGDGELLPCLVTEWVIDMNWPGSTARNAKEISERLKGDRWQGLEPETLFGKDAATEKWTYLIAADGPVEIMALKASWSCFADWQHPPVLADTDLFEQRIEAAERIISGLEGGSVSAAVNPVDAAKRVHQLANLHEKFAGEVVLRLKAPFLRKYEGKKLWDVMLCLGLRWGDMDLFHWKNESGFGDDSYFSVSTSTAPGYFLPEEVAAGSVKVDDLVFGFSLVRSADPVAVFEGMVAAAKYAQRRLGGKIVDLNGSELDYESNLSRIRS